MKYGFVIDNRKCIGCHACTTACKSEHDVPIGVNRTWVKQVEKGTFPDTRRLFSVLRCNHCTDAPCVEICPVEALFIRDDGIVDFDKRRCIGCKSCMQACPYDALYIDPETHTAAKCNYCAHRIDLGLEPACVNVCPEHAIISGDMDDQDSEISILLSEQDVTVRKEEAGTLPNVFYIDGDPVSLVPDKTEKSDSYLWSAQTRGVGHYARAAEKLAWSNEDVVQALLTRDSVTESPQAARPRKSIDILTNGVLKAKLAYDAPDKGTLWGWEVPAYVLTKAIASGTVMLFVTALLLGLTDIRDGLWTSAIAMGFLLLTGGLLVKDLDRPDRFLNVLLRPQWRSWLTRGGYAITVFGGILALQITAILLHLSMVSHITAYLSLPVAILVSVYTAFLFAQAKGRDFWQSRLLPLHMLVHSIMAGAAVYVVLQYMGLFTMTPPTFALNILSGAIITNLLILVSEFVMKHQSSDTVKTVQMIFRGRYATQFWVVAVGLGNLLPLALIFLMPERIALIVAAILTGIGIYVVEKIWIEAPQRIPLT